MNLEKYNRPVPRYTSYPPANHFTPDFGQDDYRDLIIRSNNAAQKHIAAYIHIPFCRQLCHYCGCNSCKLTDEKVVKQYVDSLKQEILNVTGLIDKNRKVSQIHFGGGTPNAIDSDFLKEIIGMISENFNFIEEPEIAIECHPGYLDIQYLQDLKYSGVNRFSLGVQDFNPEVLKTINRTPSVLPIKDLIDFIRKDPKASVNLDFIYGLPGQTVNSFAETINKAIELRPDRLVTFSYAHVPWIKKSQLILEKSGLPDADQKMAMFTKASGLLQDAGYIPVGLDHYVLPHDELYKAQQKNVLHRNFQGYCTRRTTGQVYAFGVSAISQLTDGYAQNTKNLDTYTSRITTAGFATEKGYRLSPGEMITREIITRLMCNYQLDWRQLQAEFNIPRESVESLAMNDKLEEFASEGLIEFNRDKLEVKEKGKFFIRNIAATFDPAYKPENNKYSRSV